MTTDSPKRAKFLPVPGKPVQRTTRDGVCAGHVTRATDAIQPLAETIRKLEEALDRAANRIEVAPRADRLRELREHLGRPITAGELDDPAYLRKPHPLRKELDDVVGHPFIQGLRKLREARDQ